MNKKLRATIYSLAFATALSFVAGIGCFSAISTDADNTTAERTLLFPDSYEEYLPLESPADVAISESYKAFADGHTIYLYDVYNGVYQTYEHTVFSLDDTKNAVTKLQFDKAENLYFLDASTALYRIDKSNLSNFGSAMVTDTGFVCSTFILQDDTLFFTNVTTKTQISKVPLSSLDKKDVVLLCDNLSSKPTLAFWNEELYYTNAGKYVHKMSPNGTLPQSWLVGAFTNELSSMSVNGSTFACTDINGDFYTYDLFALTASKDPNEIPVLCYEENAFSSLTSYGGFIYAVQGNAVKRYSVEEQCFDTTYAVGANLSEDNRLHGAVETVFFDNTLYIADNGNNRISIYDTVTNTYQTPIQTEFAPQFLASNKQTLMVATANGLTLYSLQADHYGETLFSYNNLADTLTGITHVYGKYYCTTRNNRFFTVEQKISEETNQPLWAIGNDTSKTYTRQTESLTADAYGQLYTLYSTSVYRYSEQEFLDQSNQTGTKIIDDLPLGTKRILVDYERNVYALTDTQIYVCKRQVNPSQEERYLPATEIVLETGDTYVKAGHTPTLTAFAFGIEENSTYLLYDGNYVVVSKELSLPTVKNIPVSGANEDIFSEETAEFTLLKTNKHALFVEFDLDVLNGADTFPYLSYKRMEEEYTVLKLGSTSDYHLVALFNTQTHRYSTYLVLKTACQAMGADEYQIVYSEQDQKNAWLSNSVALYKFPYLNRLLTACDLPRNGKVTLLGEIGGLDHEYYQVSYEVDGQTKIGFIPKTYALPYNPLGEQAETGELGKADSNTDAVWRLAYILLGLSAIAILIDFLILRKKEDD